MNDVVESNNKPCLIFSLPSPSYEEKLRDLNVPFLRMQGCNKGTLEVSYLVEDREDNYDKVLELVREAKETSVLFLNEERWVKEYYLNLCSFKPLGQFVPVSPSEAMVQESWTRKGNQFYVIR